MSGRSTGPVRVGVVGGGLAGLTCARRLADRGASVTILDAGRGPAGRASTRRQPVGDGEVPFDHGAQYFTVRDPRFFGQLAEWMDEGVAARWEGRVVGKEPGRDPGGTERFVGVPGMSALGAHLARGLDVRWGARVTAVERTEEGDAGPRLRLRTGPGRPSAPFHRVVVAVTPRRAAPLLEEVAPDLAGVARGHRMLPCWAGLMVLEDRLPTGFDGVFLGNGPLAWAARNSSKPGRPDQPEAWVVHADHGWSAERLEADPSSVAAELAGRFLAEVGGDGARPRFRSAHRWRHARSAEPRRDGALVGGDGTVVMAGDWLAGDRVEGAWLSGWTAAELLLGG